MHHFHENPEFQHFLMSRARENLIGTEIYDRFIPELKEHTNILDFGCGQGFVALYYAGKIPENASNIHIYGCDYQEEQLDLFWKRIVSRRLSHVTPFFIPNRSRLLFPSWVPAMNHVIFSFSLSAVDNRESILQTIKPLLEPDARLHVVDWLPDFHHEDIDHYFPAKYRLTAEQIQSELLASGYKIEKMHVISEVRETKDMRREVKKSAGRPFFALTAFLL